ncbi:DUF6733 family protein [Lunatibacter salilacus]|uniref:DUF6733 family protein n=1 Tax=Lunatibacter salilacus TaxID=2483804 RepID=UPI00131DBA93|nr:DUF6733 family protein [Lunatibacter salilacus]
MRKIDNLAFSKVAVVLTMICLLAASPAFSQTDDKFDFTVTLNSDQFFGFYPYFTGSYSLNETSAFTFYGILWSGGTAGAWGNWTEFGVGMDFTVADGVNINPSIGILNGTLLSSGAARSAGIFGEGVVPNIVVGLDKEKVEGEFYLGYYTPIRDEAPAGGSTNAYLHYWANFGVKASSFFSLGVHYEQLDLAGGSNVTTSTLYQWLGPYVQFSDPNGRAFARFAGGGDLVEGNDSFFKLTTGFNF